MFSLLFIVCGSFLLIANGSESTFVSIGLNVKLIVEPPQSRVGQTIKLNCSYDIEDGVVYSVKYYHKNMEFYRYMPQETPRVRIFPIQNLEVNIPGDQSVEIRPLNSAAGGRYSCEVSLDAPSFETAIAHRNITVLPSEEETTTDNNTKSITETTTEEDSKYVYTRINLKLIVEPLQSRVGETIKLNCSHDIKDDVLYSIKYYFQYMEFYRYAPQENPNSKVFDVPYIKVIKPGDNSVEIQPLNVAASGKYSCVVSVEEPSSATAMAHRHIKVLPSEEDSTAQNESNGMNLKLIVEPLRSRVGQTIKLNCSYDIEDDVVYSVKYYYENEEFYRYMPQDNPNSQVFDVPNLQVIKSRDNSVEIQPLNLAASGQYACEVSLDAPTFTTTIVRQNIIVLPSEHEITTGNEPKCDMCLHVEPPQPLLGQTVNIQCMYDIGEEELYTIKFYKDNREFYRYTPAELPREKIFPMSHLNVIETQENSVQFQPRDSKASGNYSCGVSTEAPNFKTLFVSKNITIRSPPEKIK